MVESCGSLSPLLSALRRPLLSLSSTNQLQPMTDGRVRNGRINFFNIVSVMQAPLLPLVVRSSSFGGPSRFVVAV